METDPSLEFDHFLAAKLSRTVAELRAGMSNDEWLAWAIFYARKAQRQELAAKMGR